jgi:protein-L-isoaspartate O-methyltransferase
MAFNYERDTKQHYQSAEIASTYHAAFAVPGGWRTLPARVVAARERAVVAQFLDRVPHRRILDLPAGTGKLAPVLAGLGSWIVACDIASPMLEIARQAYAAAGASDATFRICDAEQVTTTLNERFDVAVCLRLLHRVPRQVRRRILAELAACADHVIVSVGIETPYHRMRRNSRDRLFGGGRDALCYEDVDAIRSQIAPDFHILAQKWILPWVSQEMVLLLQSKVRPRHPNVRADKRFGPPARSRGQSVL